MAWLGLDAGDVFVQPVPGASVLCNDARLSASHWLRDGDRLRIGAIEITVRGNDAGLRLRLEELKDAHPTEPPLLLVPPPRVASAAAPDPARPITPIAFTPRAPGAGARRGRPALARVALAALAPTVLIAGVALATARLVAVEVEPAPERVELRDRVALRLGSRFLAWPGAYTVVAKKEGYSRLEARAQVLDEAGQTLRFTLEPLPGRLRVDTGAVAGAEVWVDGALVGRTPLRRFEVAAGERSVTVRAEGFVAYEARVRIEGRGREQDVEVALVANSAPVSVTSQPPGASVAVGGRALGVTPLTAAISAGRRTLELRLAGFKPASRTIEVAAGSPLEVPTVRLVPADGILELSSEPAGAVVTVGGVHAGQTPLELTLAPGREHSLRLTRAGHEGANLSVNLRAGERRAEAVRLEPRLGEVVVAVRPPDAELFVDGEPRGRADQTLRLLAVPHEIEIRRAGYVGVKRTLTPTPGFPQAIRLALDSAEEAKRRSQPERLRSPEGHELRLVRGMAIRMGAPRREPGRRANEPQRDVVLERPFYVALHEVSNAQYRRFDPKHSSGRVADQSLDMDDHPVVRLTWQQAAAYCNWLSAKEGLAPVYSPQGERLRAASPLGTGYRLPTEAEWEAVARHAEGGEPLRYPWGRALPVPPGFGNYADASAAGLIARLLPGYDDGFRATAPVASFAPNGLGFHHLGDNVAEWAHDFYTIVPSAEGQTVKDPTGPAEGEYHVIRGASWMHAGATELRLSFRDYGKEARPDVGLRVARYAE